MVYIEIFVWTEPLRVSRVTAKERGLLGDAPNFYWTLSLSLAAPCHSLLSLGNISLVVVRQVDGGQFGS